MISLVVSEFLADLREADTRLRAASARTGSPRPVADEFDPEAMASLGRRLDDALLSARRNAADLLEAHKAAFPLSPVFCDIPMLGPLGMGHRETAVTQLLAWMLHPSESHGFGDRMLVAFLSALPNGSDLIPRVRLPGAKLSAYSEFTLRGMGRADIVVINDAPEGADRFCLIVEAKIGASEGADQTRRYVAGFSERYSDCRYYYLTIRGVASKSMQFTPIAYRELARHFVRALSSLEYAPGFHLARHFVCGLLLDLCNLRPSADLRKVLAGSSFEIESLLGPEADPHE